MKFFKSLVFKYILYYLIILITLQIYTNFSIGYFKNYTLVQNSFIEYLTILFIYTVFFITTKGKYLIYLPPLFLLSYIIIDFISDSYNRYLDYSDIKNIPLLFDALLQSKGSIVYVSLIYPILYIYFFIKYKIIRLYTLSLVVVILLFTIPLPFSTHTIISKPYKKLYSTFAYTKAYFWTPNKLKQDYAKTGRLSTFFYSGMIKQERYNTILKHITDQKKQLSLIVNDLKSHLDKRNVYLIGLESFFVPKDLTKLKLKYLNNDKNITYDVIKNSSTKITSIFGGGTIQSEFEALCGVPALQKISAFEFTEFIGSPTNCLPQILKALNYSTIVTNTYKPQPSFEALKSVGFQSINFPKEYFPNKPSYLTNKNKADGEYAIFDADLYNQNLSYIKKNFLDKQKPIFNYMFSVWGHAFFDMTDPKRKKAIQITNADTLGVSEHTIDAINQDYYRIKALQDFFDKIKKTDPTALVIAYSDHRPVLDGVESHKRYGLKSDVFHNFIVIMDKSKYIRYNSPFPLYALPDIILDRLTNGWYCKTHACKINSNPKDREKFLNDYYTIMANAMNPNYKRDDFFVKLNKTYYFDDENIAFKNFSHAERSFRWTNGKKAMIYFKLKDKKTLPIYLKLHIATLGKQKISIYLNNHLLYSKVLNTPDTTLNLKLRPSFLKKEKVNTLTFNLPTARRPGNGDPRILALALKSIKFTDMR